MDAARPYNGNLSVFGLTAFCRIRFDRTLAPLIRRRQRVDSRLAEPLPPLDHSAPPKSADRVDHGADVQGRADGDGSQRGPALTRAPGSSSEVAVCDELVRRE